MYLDHFSLKERPFSISPDPRFLFMSNRYREALAHLTFGVKEGGGFVLLTGEVGTGKTTVCRCLLQQLPENTRLAFVLNPKLDSLELLATILDELDIPYPENCQSLKQLTDRLTEYLLKCYQKDLNVVVMIDEAQNLANDVLEQIRLLTNLETNQKKLLQIILVGQPELQEKLALRELRQLAQRITARYHLRPLSQKETIAYVLHRGRIAGASKSLFTVASIELLHQKTAGIPRLVNTICDRALFAAANRHKSVVDPKIMAEAIREVLGDNFEQTSQSYLPSKKLPLKKLAGAAVALVVLSLVFWLGQKTAEPLAKESLNSEQAVAPSSKRFPQIQNQAIQNQAVQNQAVQNQAFDLVEQLLGQEPWDSNGNRAMVSLLALWQLDYSPLREGDGCDFAASYNLRCSRHIGNWQQLREFNRPAILRFSAGLQGEFWGTLKAIEGFEAVMQFGDKESRVRLEQLSSIWSGDFILIWQAPGGFMNDIKMGDRGETVSWLAARIAEIDGVEAGDADLFDIELKQRLVEFQSKRNLNADGIAGMQTILKINQATLKGIPLLSRS